MNTLNYSDILSGKEQQDGRLCKGQVDAIKSVLKFAKEKPTKGGIICMPPASGKTATIIVSAILLKQHVLIVTPPGDPYENVLPHFLKNPQEEDTSKAKLIASMLGISFQEWEDFCIHHVRLVTTKTTLAEIRNARILVAHANYLYRTEKKHGSKYIDTLKKHVNVILCDEWHRIYWEDRLAWQEIDGLKCLCQHATIQYIGFTGTPKNIPTDMTKLYSGKGRPSRTIVGHLMEFYDSDTKLKISKPSEYLRMIHGAAPEMLAMSCVFILQDLVYYMQRMKFPDAKMIIFKDEKDTHSIFSQQLTDLAEERNIRHPFTNAPFRILPKTKELLEGEPGTDKCLYDVLVSDRSGREGLDVPSIVFVVDLSGGTKQKTVHQTARRAARKLLNPVKYPYFSNQDQVGHLYAPCSYHHILSNLGISTKHDSARAYYRALDVERIRARFEQEEKEEEQELEGQELEQQELEQQELEEQEKSSQEEEKEESWLLSFGTEKDQELENQNSEKQVESSQEEQRPTRKAKMTANINLIRDVDPCISKKRKAKDDEDESSSEYEYESDNESEDEESEYEEESEDEEESEYEEESKEEDSENSEDSDREGPEYRSKSSRRRIKKLGAAHIRRLREIYENPPVCPKCNFKLTPSKQIKDAFESTVRLRNASEFSECVYDPDRDTLLGCTVCLDRLKTQKAELCRGRTCDQCHMEMVVKPLTANKASRYHVFDKPHNRRVANVTLATMKQIKSETGEVIDFDLPTTCKTCRNNYAHKSYPRTEKMEEIVDLSMEDVVDTVKNIQDIQGEQIKQYVRNKTTDTEQASRKIAQQRAKLTPSVPIDEERIQKIRKTYADDIVEEGERLDIDANMQEFKTYVLDHKPKQAGKWVLANIINKMHLNNTDQSVIALEILRQSPFLSNIPWGKGEGFSGARNARNYVDKLLERLTDPVTGEARDRVYRVDVPGQKGCIKHIVRWKY